ncbi:hypothetical protein TNCV_3482051 [Trichonephila clavipes]|nr:hypothetical protein TNCV_3482051 [Trichonephila clavipes]
MGNDYFINVAIYSDTRAIGDGLHNFYIGQVTRTTPKLAPHSPNYHTKVRRRESRNVKFLVLCPSTPLKILLKDLSQSVPRKISTTVFSTSLRGMLSLSNLCNGARRRAVAEFHLATGHDCLQNHLYRVKVVPAPIYTLCSSGKIMDSAHFLHCPALHKTFLNERYWETRD